MLLPTIDDIDIKDKRVLLRLDFDFLFQKGFKITDNHEFNLVVPTIKRLIDENAKIIIVANYSGLKSKTSAEYSMENFAAVLCKVFDCEVYLTEEHVGQVVNKISQDMLPGGILLLNNFSGLSDENSNNPDFAKRLAEVSDVYINEAFTLSHLELASTTSVLNYYESGQICVGYNFENEYNLIKSLHDNKHPFALVVNTDKISEGIEFIENFIDEIDKLFLIGEISDATSNLYNSSSDFGISMKVKEKIECVIKSISVRDITVHHPVDYYIESVRGTAEQVNVKFLQNDNLVLDIGDSTGNLFSELLSDVKKLVWFGPLPFKSDCGFVGGSSKIFDTIKQNNIFSVGLIENPVKGSLNFEGACGFNHVSSCYDTSIQYIKKEDLPVLNFIEGKFE